MKWHPGSIGSVEAVGAASMPRSSTSLRRRLTSKSAGNALRITRPGPKTIWLSSPTRFLRSGWSMIGSGGEVVDRLILDTSAYSHFRAGHPEVLDQLAQATAVVIPVTVLGELEAAFQLGRRARENRL